MRHTILYFSFCLIIASCTDTEVTTKVKEVLQIDKEEVEIPINQIEHDFNYAAVSEIPVPDGYQRLAANEGSFAVFLRKMKLKKGQSKVHLYDGTLKDNQRSQFAIMDIDVGTRDLQQCADAVMRLRGEYLFAEKRYADIHFNFLSDGKPRYYTDYAGSDRSQAKFRKYMDYIFSYANTRSLYNELPDVAISDIRPGDTFISTGNPYGHAVMVMDVAIHESTGKRIFMLAQSYMPAQEIHILVNDNDDELSPWYILEEGEGLITPEWIFEPATLKRF